MNRPPAVKCNTTPHPDAPGARADDAKRGEAYRRIFVHYHAVGDQAAADVVLHVYRRDDGAPVVEVVASPADAIVGVAGDAIAGAQRVQDIRNAVKASEAQPWRTPVQPEADVSESRDILDRGVAAYWRTWSSEEPAGRR